jgi:hypothetical protein
MFWVVVVAWKGNGRLFKDRWYIKLISERLGWAMWAWSNNGAFLYSSQLSLCQLNEVRVYLLSMSLSF